MQSPLVPGNSVEVQVKPEKIYATVFFIPLIFLLLGFYKYLFVLSSSYYLTDQQLIIERGVFTRRVNYLELYRIKDIVVNQSFWMKTIGLMNITLLSFDSSESLLILKGIKISELLQSIRNHVQECRKRNKVLTVDN